MLRGQRQREVHRARLLRVGERHGREVRVRLLLLLDHPRRAEARGLEHLEHRRATDAVQRRVDEVEVARPVLGELRDRVEVAVDDVLAEHGPAGAAGHVPQRADRVDPGRDPGVRRRHDLAAVAEVDLVAVVLGRVVARGDHDAGRAAELADRERHHRRRQRPRHHPDLEAGTRHHLGGVAGEVVAAVPRVEADHHRAGRALLVQVCRQPGRGADHDDPVHPVRTRTHRSAQPRRPELQAPREPVGQVGRVGAALHVGDDLLQLGPRGVVGVLGRPGPGTLQQDVGGR